MIRGLSELLNGKKTYIGMIAAGVLGIIQSLGWVEPEQVRWLWVTISAWTGVSLKHSWDKKGG